MADSQDIPPRRYKLTRLTRLGRKRDYQRVFDLRCSVADSVLIVYAAPNDVARPRLGIAVSARLGGAVVRTRVRRLLREGFRLTQHDLPPGFDYVLLPRNSASELADYRTSLAALSTRAAAKCNRAAQRN
jgi:ribonuclease P protein component